MRFVRVADDVAASRSHCQVQHEQCQRFSTSPLVSAPGSRSCSADIRSGRWAPGHPGCQRARLYAELMEAALSYASAPRNSQNLIWFEAWALHSFPAHVL